MLNSVKSPLTTVLPTIVQSRKIIPTKAENLTMLLEQLSSINDYCSNEVVYCLKENSTLTLQI